MPTNEPLSKPNQQTSSPQSTSTPPPAQTPSLQQPTSQRKSPKWLVVGLIVLLFGATSVFAYKYYQLKQQLVEKQSTLSPTPTLTPAPSPTLTPASDDPTGRWQTYTNEKYRYSIKYPSEIKVFEGPGSGERIQETVLNLFGPKYIADSEFSDGFGITLAVISNPSNKTPTQFAQEYYQQAEQNIYDKIFEGDISKCKVEDAIKDNNKGARFTYCTQAPGVGIINFSEWYVINGNTYEIYAVLQNKDYLTIFNQVLSTIKFTN